MPPGATSLHEAESVFATRRLMPTGQLVAEDSFAGPALPEKQAVRFTTEDGGGMRGSMLLPLAHQPAQVVGPGGDLWVTEGGGAYSIRRQRVGGDTVLIIDRAFTPVEVSDSARDEAEKGLAPPGGTRFTDNDPSRLPGVYPPFEAFFPATDGVLWTRRTVEGDSVVLDVFDADGRYLGTPETAVDVAALDVHLVTDRSIYGVVRDEMDVESVVVLRIERP